MLYKGFALALFLGSCSSIDLNSAIYQSDVTIALATPHQKEEFSVIDIELRRLFKTATPSRKCNIELSILKTAVNTGISSTLFAVNKNITMTVNYTIACSDGLKTKNSVTQSTDLTLQQEQTVAQYVGENRISHALSLQIAKSINDEFKLFLATNIKI